MKFVFDGYSHSLTDEEKHNLFEKIKKDSKMIIVNLINSPAKIDFIKQYLFAKYTPKNHYGSDRYILKIESILNDGVNVILFLEDDISYFVRQHFDLNSINKSIFYESDNDKSNILNGFINELFTSKDKRPYIHIRVI